MKIRIRNSNERGVSVTEYAIMLMLVALGVVAFGSDIQEAIAGAFQSLIDFLS